MVLGVCGWSHNLVMPQENYFEVSWQHVGKKVHEIEDDETDELSDQRGYYFFIETINFQNSAGINHFMNEIPVTTGMIGESCNYREYKQLFPQSQYPVVSSNPWLFWG